MAHLQDVVQALYEHSPFCEKLLAILTAIFPVSTCTLTHLHNIQFKDSAGMKEAVFIFPKKKKFLSKHSQ